MKKIVIDAYGGDNAPNEIVSGALLALDEDSSLSLVLAGKRAELEKLIVRHFNKIEIIDANEVITNDESPTLAIKKKTDSTLVKAFDALASRDDIGGLVSAGSTGAILTGAFLKVGRIKGISRPALAPLLPTIKNGKVVLCDCGANVDCKAINLLHFAYMGTAFYKLSTGQSNARVGLLSNGTEENKGSELTNDAFNLIKKSSLNFVGNIEAREILSGDVDVVVADGFNGNIALKGLEGAALAIFSQLKDSISQGGIRAKIGALMLKPALKQVKSKMDYNANGGAVFLGVEKVVVKAHGSAEAKSICVAILQAFNLVKLGIVEEIKKELKEMKAIADA